MADDEYTGKVRPGGPTQVRRLGCLTLTKVAVDEQMSNNCYLLHCGETDEMVVVDAAAEPERLLELIGDASVTTIVTTHQHWDHHRGLAEVQRTTGATVAVGTPDADAVEEQTGVRVDRRLEHGDRVAVGTCDLRVIALAGHTPGSVALLLDDEKVDARPHLLTGDSLFPGGVGNTFGDDEAFAQLVDEVETKVFGTLPDETWFYPGHGDDSTLGAERPHLQEWRERGW